MSFLGNILGGGPSNDQKQSNNLLNFNAQQAKPIADNATNNANSAFNRGGQLVSTGQTFFNTGNGTYNSGNNTVNQGLGYLNQAQNTLNAPSNYFQQLLSGNQAATTQALAPQINQIRQQNQNTLQATNNLAPRGGGRSSTLFNLPYQNDANIAGAYNGARASAAGGLTSIGGLQSNTGLGTGALGTNIINAGTGQVGAGTGIVNSGTGQGALGEGLLGQATNAYGMGNQAAGIYGNQAAQQQAVKNQIGQQAGAGIGNLLTNFPTILNMMGF